MPTSQGGRAQKWLPEWQTLSRVPCHSKLMKICLLKLAGNLLSRMLAQTVHREVSHWSHPNIQLAKVGAGVNFRLLITMHCRSLQVSTQEPGRRTPLSPMTCPVPSTDKALCSLAKEEYLKGSPLFLQNRQWSINLPLKYNKSIPGIPGSLHVTGITGISGDRLVQFPMFQQIDG